MIERLLFVGSKALGLSVLRLIHDRVPAILTGAITIDDSNDCRSAYEDFAKFTRDRGIPLETVKTRHQFRSVLEKYQPEKCVVVGWYSLIDRETLRMVPNGFSGIHASLLPKYRGSAPLVWALINGEREVGVSFFRFGDGIDDGPIWFQKRVAVGPQDDIATVLDAVESATLGGLETKLVDVLSSSVAPRPQDEAMASYCAPRLPFDGRIDWTNSAEDIFNFVRAQTRPYPGAFSYLEDNDGRSKVTIWKCEPAKNKYSAVPGRIARRDVTGIYVGCGDNSAVRLVEIEVNGVVTEPEVVLRSFGKGLQ